MKLYEYTMLIDQGFDPETGEIFDEEAIEQLNLNRIEKIEAIACFYKDVKKFEEDVKEEIDRLNKEVKRCEKKREWVKRYLSSNMTTDEKIKTVKCQVGFRKSDKVIVLDVNALPDEYKAVKYEPKKTELKKAMEKGEEFDGVFIQTDYNINIK